MMTLRGMSMAQYKKAKGIRTPWIPHGAGMESVGLAENEIVATYRKQLQELHGLLKEFYLAADPKDGVLTYPEIARDGRLKGLLFSVQNKVDAAFYSRAQILRKNLRRGYNNAYTDILYQAEKIAYASQIRGKEGVLAWDTRIRTAREIARDEEFEEFMRLESDKLADTLGANIEREREYSKQRLQYTLKAALTGAGVTLRDWYTVLRDETDKSAGRMLRIVRTQGNHIINEARVSAFRSEFAEHLLDVLGAKDGNLTDEAGDRLVLVWRHDEPKMPRPWHIHDLDYTVADKAGLWWSSHTGKSARAPGGFNDPAEDAYCRCYLQLMPLSEVRGMSTNKGVIPVPADYIGGAA